MSDRTNLILRVAVAFAFLYPAVAAWFDPFAWIGYFPPALLDAAGEQQFLLLHAFGAVEVVLALWILSGWRIAVPSALSAAALLLIVTVNTSQLDVLFRDIPIALAALALFFDALYRGRAENPAFSGSASDR